MIISAPHSPSSNRPFAWGIVGTGVIAAQFVADLAEVHSARIGAFVSRRGQVPDAFRTAAPEARIYTALDALLADDTIDAIYLATPNSLHAEQAIACCRAGKPVLVEKPIGRDADEARAIQVEAAKSQTFVMEAMWSRFLPVVEEARALIRSGALGDIQSFEGDLSFFKPFDAASRFFDPVLGGGAALDLGVYPLSMALHLLGQPEKAGGRWWAAETGVDMRARFDLTIGGATGQLSCGFDRDGDNRFVVRGTKGTLVLHGPFLKASRLSVSAPWLEKLPGLGSRSPLPGRGGRLLSRLPVPGRRIITRSFAGGGLQFEAQAVMRAVRGAKRASSVMPLQASIAVLEIIQRVLAQSPENRR
ncbi:Gfo/Idh/MocA family oxidoreductase [Tianweitania sp. BSSL-BM11]|uniref:Gfo/Idh/MocA family oxidoreductase n=1 Tax=Tianweitania aestuarii TaxID=2814886 RepID=A0ABS5RVL6_9HYPH|nr:Gfo/Idh/MocA family oxidoreductase [Tianweitania aestuarii]MBS9721120.1 Gfo/Idh/MocA family oxidoreductase [Tianweitania aestuarii]